MPAVFSQKDSDQRTSSLEIMRRNSTLLNGMKSTSRENTYFHSPRKIGMWLEFSLCQEYVLIRFERKSRFP